MKERSDKKKLSQRQQALLKELPKHNYNVEKAGLKAGYSPTYAHGLLYRAIRKYKEKSEEDIRLEFITGLDKDIKRFKKQEDNTCYLRAKELKSKILALQVDKSEVTNKNPEKVMIVYGSKPASKPE